MHLFSPSKYFVVFAILVCAVLYALPCRAEQDPDVVITRAYEDLLGRKPDKEGLRAYRIHMIDDGWSEKKVRENIRKSPEYKGKDLDVDKVITRAYEDLLRRKPDPAGLEAYRKRMIEDGWSEKKVRENIRKSGEYKNR